MESLHHKLSASDDHLQIYCTVEETPLQTTGAELPSAVSFTFCNLHPIVIFSPIMCPGKDRSEYYLALQGTFKVYSPLFLKSASNE